MLFTKTFVRGSANWEIGLLPGIEEPNPIRAGYHAISATNTLVVIDLYYPVLPLAGAPGGAYLCAHWVGAIVALDGDKFYSGIGIFPERPCQNPGKEDTGWDEILHLTGQHASSATHASSQIYYHAISH